MPASAHFKQKSAARALSLALRSDADLNCLQTQSKDSIKSVYSKVLPLMTYLELFIVLSLSVVIFGTGDIILRLLAFVNYYLAKNIKKLTNCV